MNKPPYFRILVIGLGVVTMLSCARAAGQQEKKFDGNWWLLAPSFEQSGFLTGYLDCYIYEFRGTDRFSKPTEEYVQLLTDWYRVNPGVRYRPVGDMIHEFRDRPGDQPREGGEKWDEDHGYFDGAWWKLVSALEIRRLERLGFVEGYLWCHTVRLRGKDGTFSKTAGEYVSFVTQWYGLDEKTGDIDGSREPEKIASVLHKFRDGTPPPDPESSAREEKPAPTPKN
jgi:hypothetical protein